MQCYRKKLKLIDKSSLGLNNNVFVNENFTPVNSKIVYNCRKLKRNNLISKTYTVNGTVHLISDQKKKKWETSENTRYKIAHLFASGF